MKMLTIAGNIGRNAETRHTQGGDTVTSWPVAVEGRNGQEKTTMWFDCALWGKRGEALAQYLTKGSRVSCAGDLGTREHNGKTHLTLRVDQITLMGGGGRQEARPDKGEVSRQAFAPAQTNALDDDAIPFAPEVRG